MWVNQSRVSQMTLQIEDSEVAMKTVWENTLPSEVKIHYLTMLIYEDSQVVCHFTGWEIQGLACLSCQQQSVSLLHTKPIQHSF
jgi:hypothetical protein